MITRLSVWFCELPLWVKMVISAAVGFPCGFIGLPSAITFSLAWFLFLDSTFRIWTREHQRRLDCELQQFSRKYQRLEFNLTNVNNYNERGNARNQERRH